jgi:hypothetical protein
MGIRQSFHCMNGEFHGNCGWSLEGAAPREGRHEDYLTGSKVTAPLTCCSLRKGASE